MNKKTGISRETLKLSIIKILLKSGDSTQKALAEALGVSRATVASLCEELIDKKLIFRRNERCYALDPAKDFMILKIYREVAELVSCQKLSQLLAVKPKTNMKITAVKTFVCNAFRTNFVFVKTNATASKPTTETAKPTPMYLTYGEE